ncbi:MAG TPA: hypothetical protein VHM30_15460 [Gemmatimonadaceae bacterium]|nr:hypothetical protein [Gemmatimonadaceae bacterium]
MAHRIFVDTEGTRWQAWDVTPNLAERRHGERRGTMRAAAMTDRRAMERRHRHEARVRVREGLEQGWLAFESVVGNKRLAPIPQGWESLPDSALESLCRAASDAPRQRRRLIE